MENLSHWVNVCQTITVPFCNLYEVWSEGVLRGGKKNSLTGFLMNQLLELAESWQNQADEEGEVAGTLLWDSTSLALGSTDLTDVLKYCWEDPRIHRFTERPQQMSRQWCVYWCRSQHAQARTAAQYLLLYCCFPLWMSLKALALGAIFQIEI